MALFHHQPLSFTTPSQKHGTNYSGDMHDDTWAAPMAPGVFDFDPCTPSPVKMAFDFQPLQYECKQFRQDPIPPSAKAPHAPHLMSVEWSSPGDLFEHIEDIRDRASSPLNLAPVPAPARDETLSPMPVSAASSLLRAPRLRTMPLLMSHPCSPVPYVDDEPSELPSTPTPPAAGTRPPLPHRFSALGLDLTSVPAKEHGLLSPPPSPSAGRGRRRRRAATLDVAEVDDEEEEERGRRRERRRRTEDEDDVPGLTFCGRDDDAPSSELRARVETWCGAVAAATHSQPSTPPDFVPISALPAYDEAQLAQALGRLNADARSPTDSLWSSGAEHPLVSSPVALKAPRPQRSPMRSQTSFPPQQAPAPFAAAVKPQRPAFHRALSLQLEQHQQRQQQELAAQLDPWAQRVGRARGRRVDMPRLQRSATRTSVSGSIDKRGAI